MALQQESAWLIAISACGCAALGIGAYGIGTGAMPGTLVAAGLMALGLGLALSQLQNHFRAADAEEDAVARRVDAQRLDRLEQRQRDWQFTHEGLSQQIAALQAEAHSGTSALTRGIEDIRQAHATLASRIETLVARPVSVQPVFMQPAPVQHVPVEQPAFEAYAPAPEMMEAAMPHEAAPPVDDTPFGDRLSLALEPVVDLFSSQTAHYRLLATMLNDRGEEVAPEMFAHHVAQLGQRALLDTFIVRETIGILGHLRQRDPQLCVLVPVGAATLADRAHLQAILGYIDAAPEAAAGLVLDINHGVLASLPDASLEGLATLARHGVALALSQVSIAGVDLAALSKLNVRYVCLAAASLSLGMRPQNTVTGFIQAARALRIQTIITQVSDPQALAEIMRTARLACGPAFAAPRRLKRAAAEDAGLPAAA